MQSPIINLLNGYCFLNHHIYFDVRNKKLALEELAFLGFLASLTCFDKAKYNYGYVSRSRKEIAEFLNLNPSTVTRYTTKLIKKAYVIEDKLKGLKVVDIESWLKAVPRNVNKQIANMKREFAEMQFDIADTQSQIANMQQISTQSMPLLYGAFRREVSSIYVDSNNNNNNYQLNKITIQENGLSEDDIRIIDEIVSKSTPIIDSSKALIENLSNEELIIFAKSIFGEGTKLFADNKVYI